MTSPSVVFKYKASPTISYSSGNSLEDEGNMNLSTVLFLSCIPTIKMISSYAQGSMYNHYYYRDDHLIIKATVLITITTVSFLS